MKAFWEARARRLGTQAVTLDEWPLFLNWAVAEVWDRAWRSVDGTFVTLLDAGTGVGRLLHHLKQNSPNVVGVDISLGMIRMAKRLYEDVDLCVMSLDHLGFRDKSFDLVNSAFVVMHIPDAKHQGMAIDEVARVVKRGGTLLMAEEILSRSRAVGFEWPPFWRPLRLNSLTLEMKEEGLDLRRSITGLPYGVLLLLCKLSVITRRSEPSKRLAWLLSTSGYFLTILLQRVFNGVAGEDSMFRALIFEKKR